MGIGKGKSRVARNGYGLGRRRKSYCAFRCCGGFHQAQQGMQVQRRIQLIGDGIDELIKVAAFLCLDQPKMTGWMCQVGPATQRGKDRDVEGLQSIAEHGFVPFGADVV